MTNKLIIYDEKLQVKTLIETYKQSKEYKLLLKNHRNKMEQIRLERKPRHFDHGRATFQDKAPKLRFRPGSFVYSNSRKQMYEILYCYRIKEYPNEWMFYLEERNDLKSPETILSRLLETVAPCSENRIQYTLFRTSIDAESFFSNVYHHADGRIVFNKTMLNEMEVISSGEVF